MRTGQGDVAGLGLPVVTSLPPGPSEGQECLYAADAASGVLWHMKYLGGMPAPYRWVCVGGPPILVRVDASESDASTSASFHDLSGGTVGPSYTLPLTGDWDFEFGASLASFGTGNNNPEAGLRIGATVPAAADVIDAYVSSGPVHVARLIRKTGLASTTVVKLQYREQNASGGGVSAARRWLAARPIRVSG